MAKSILILLCLLAPGCAGTRAFSDHQASAGSGPELSWVSRSEPAAVRWAGHDEARREPRAPAAESRRPESPEAEPGPEVPPASSEQPTAEPGGELMPPDLLDSQPPPDGRAAGMGIDLAPDELPGEARPDRLLPGRRLLANVFLDHVHYYYSAENLTALAAGIGLAAAMANTGADENFRHFYQENIRDASTDEYFEALHAPNILGDGTIMLPVFAGAALVGYVTDGAGLGGDVGQWGGRSLRTFLVGGPPLLAMQVITGGSRPGETAYGSQWRPWRDANGVSGHSFVGAIPFLSAAKMTDNLVWKAAFYVASTLPGLSRINDDRHYASQVILGWWMAYLAATAVDNTQSGDNHLSLFPMPISDGIGIGLEYRR